MIIQLIYIVKLLSYKLGGFVWIFLEGDIFKIKAKNAEYYEI